MTTLNLHVTYRPLRIGWCIREGDIADLTRAVRLTHTLWGGRYNPLIPVGEDLRLAHALVKLYRVDALYPIATDPVLDGFISELRHLPWPAFRGNLFSQVGGRREPTFLDVTHPTLYIRKRRLDPVERPGIQPALFTWDNEDPLATVFGTTFGMYPDPDETGIDYSGFFQQNLDAQPTHLDIDAPIAAEAIVAFTPSVLTSVRLMPDRHARLGDSGVYFGSANHFKDLLHYWNLRAADLELLFYDPAHTERMANIPARFADERDADEWSRPLLCCRADNVPEEATTFGARFLKSRVSSATWNGLNLTPPLMHFRHRSALASVNQESDRCSVAFSLPDKPIVEEARLGDQLLVADVRPLSDVREEEFTFRAPNLPRLNDYYSREITLHPGRARAGVDAIGIVVESWREDLTLFALRTRSLAQQIFKAYGIEAEASRAGLIGARLIQQMDGLQGCRVFKVAGVRDLIEDYTPYQTFTRGAACRKIGRIDPRTNRPDFDAYKHIYLEASQRGPLQPKDAFTYLVRRGVFRVGLTLKCPNCELDFWIPLDAARTGVECELCGFAFQSTPQLKDRDWRYRRSGLFGREDYQEGSIPVALTLQQLHTTFFGVSPGWIGYATAMELEPNGAAISPCETDFAVLLQEPDGTVILVIGECKTRGEISEEHVANLTRGPLAPPPAR